MTSMPPAALALDHLPRWEVLRVVYVADERQRLGRLPSNAVRGTLGHVARELGDTTLDGLLEGLPGQGIESATDRGPPAIGVQGPYQPDAGVELRAGDTLELRVHLIGDRALQHRAAVKRALRRVGERGIARPTRKGRPRLDLLELGAPPLATPPSGAVRMRVASPLRVRIKDTEVLAPDLDTLWRQLLIRADGLARAFGRGPICCRRDAVTRGIDGVWTDVRTADVRRASARQRRSMTWRGTLGTLALHRVAPEAGPLLALAADLGLGKGAAMGCGRIALLPPAT